MNIKEVTNNRAYEYCYNLIESLNKANLKDINFYVNKLRIYEYILDDDQKAILYEAEQLLDVMTE
jgi:hypothetical protein|tara:strand:+ start:87 stop:281 length:195 start_codon:yes stop_codon:yes gene_type:complete